MTTAMCYRPERNGKGERSVALPMLGSGVEANPNPVGGVITGPRDISAVKMLRVSVTDVCNLRCVYCMPAEGVEWLPKSHVLSFEEIVAVVRAAVELGVTHFKLTGGEPTARRDLPVLVKMLRGIGGVKDLSLTTNGILLLPMLEKLKDAGLDRMTISLDSLKPEKFSEITRGGDFAKVWGAIERAVAMGFSRIKINVVVMKGMNEDEVAAFAGLTRGMPITVRFIEFMPLGRSGLTDDPENSMVTEGQIRAAIEAEHGAMVAVERGLETGVGPAKVWRLDGAVGRIGFISAMSAPFCESCNRLRLTPDGLLRSCLFDGGEIDLKPILRGAEPPIGDVESMHGKLLQAFTTCVAMKPETHSFRGNKAMNRIGGEKMELDKIENLFRELLSGKRRPKYGINVRSAAFDFSELHVDCTLLAGERYCCSEPGCHLPSSCEKLIEIASAHNLHIPENVTVHWHWVVQPGAILDVLEPIGGSPESVGYEQDAVLTVDGLKIQ